MASSALPAFDMVLAFLAMEEGLADQAQILAAWSPGTRPG